jgi:radical SAM protein with 4Fe4S-binding SPASM domain
MFDISFVRKSMDLRKQILNGNAPSDVLEQFEELRSKTPYIFQVETTNVCNMTCVMCPRTTLMDREINTMEMETFQSVVDGIIGFTDEELILWDRYIHKHGLESSLEDAKDEDYFYYFICAQAVTLHGFGDPLLDKQLVERIQYCTYNDKMTYFSTNPVNISLKVMDRLGKAGLSFLKLHLDGVDNESQLKYRGRVDKTYEESQQKVLDTLKLFKEKGYKTKIFLTKLKFNNEDDLDDQFLDFWKQHDVFAYIKNQHNRWLYEEPDAVSNSAEYMQRYCEFPWTSMSLLQDGSVVPCPLEYNADLVLGNVKEESLSEIWNGNKYEEFRKMHVTADFPEKHFCTTQCDFNKLYEKL